MHVYDRKAADTRQRFIDSAFELFTRQGYRATSMNEIARHSGGSRANLYLHFRNKPDIVLARMRDLEPTFAAPFTTLFDEPPATHTQALAWLATMKNLWMEGRVESPPLNRPWAMMRRWPPNGGPWCSGSPTHCPS